MADQRFDLGCPSMSVEGSSVHAEQKYYSHSKDPMHVVNNKNQAVANGCNIMHAE